MSSNSEVIHNLSLWYCLLIFENMLTSHWCQLCLCICLFLLTAFFAIWNFHQFLDIDKLPSLRSDKIRTVKSQTNIFCQCSLIASSVLILPMIFQCSPCPPPIGQYLTVNIQSHNSSRKILLQAEKIKNSFLCEIKVRDNIFYKSPKCTGMFF